MFVYSLSGLELTGDGGGAAIEVEDNETTARTAVYQTFGRMLLPLDDETWDITKDGGWAKELDSSGALLTYSWEIGDQPVPADRSGAESQYAAIDSALVSGAYTDDVDKNRDEVVRFYEYFGLKTAADARPMDHLVTQIDFMQFLTFKEAVSSSDRLRGSFRRAQLDFLDRQLSLWVPQMAERVSGSGSEMYSWAASAFARFVEADHVYAKGLLGG
ncbi:MAG: molecular chaperone TorD family protein [Acidimicrobiia bacterium]|nr:molecular chaperone TorD family protein [Acidimicrobiia bacterium]